MFLKSFIDRKNKLCNFLETSEFVFNFRKSVFAGVCISLGGTVYLSVGSITGAILFSFGLLAVVYYKLPLYTGRAGFCKDMKDVKQLPIILLGNIFGAFFTALAIKCAQPKLVLEANKILISRSQLDIFQMLLLPIFCGIIMTIVVRFARKNKFLPLLIGIPLFILSGFIHSIADAFYYSLASLDLFVKNMPTLIIAYSCAVFGNFLGCILPNEFMYGMFLDCSKEGDDI